METKYLKKYAPEARRDFIAAVKNKAAVYGLLPDGKLLPMKEEGDVVIIGDRPFPRSVAKQRKELEARIRKEGFQQFIEAVAYTWFNRFVAIRYMEIHGYLDHGYRVLSHPEGKSTPEILENAERVELPGLKRDEVVDLKLDGGKDEQLYQMLLLAQCNALHKAMPFLFESIKDGTELLLPDNLLHTDSLVRTLVNDIPEEQWENVEIIGWLYQFYISEKKDEVIGKVVKSEDIPAATQLFTPNWIVRYMLHNTLGRKWLATYPDSPLKQQMEFYIEPADQTPEVQRQLDEITPDSLNPEELTLLDPACGSGHILVEAYDLFKAIYTERGYRPRDIPKLILTKNLYGLEIDDRAAQLAAFALMMKARADDRNIFEQDLQPHVLSIQESKGLDAREITEALNAPLPDGSTGDISQAFVAHLIELFEDGKTLGSLIQVPPRTAGQLKVISERIEAVLRGGDLLTKIVQPLLQFVNQAKALSSTYSTVVANPPYMGRRYCNHYIKDFLREHFEEFDNDLFSAFVMRGQQLASDDGHLAFMMPFVWMFISSHKELRHRIISNHTISSLVQLEYSGFAGATVPVCTFTLMKTGIPDFVGSYIRLSEFRGSENQAPRTLEAIRNRDCGWFYNTKQSEFSAIPGLPIAYWASKQMRRCFSESKLLQDSAHSLQGMITGDNDKFLRFWAEVDYRTLALNKTSISDVDTTRQYWLPYNKGGDLRKWYGNNEFVLNWSNHGKDLTRSRTQNRQYYLKPCVTWTFISSSFFAARYCPAGFVWDVAGSSAFPTSKNGFSIILGLMCSKLGKAFLDLMNPTLNFQVENILALPIHPKVQNASARLEELFHELTKIAKQDWDASEVSWDFESLPWVQVNGEHSTVSEAWQDWERITEQCIARMSELEQENNAIFFEAYGLQEELSTDVPENQITLYRAAPEEDIKRLLSYAIGCIMGRYSLDKPGLIYAQSGSKDFDPGQYTTFKADDDGIIPITDMPWFPDDAANRFEQFIKTAWPEEHLEENLKFVAESLDQKKGEATRECIRRYLATGFYKHHLSMYKKRPIYWLFSSGKQRAFQCLVYLHRYNSGTLSRMRTEYVVKLQGKINSRIDQLESDIPAASSTSQRKQLEKELDTLIKQRDELQDFDEKLREFADRRIDLDLDDGVKVNYGKFGDLLAEVKAITGGKSED